MTVTYDCIATTTLSSSASGITLSSISGSYTDLILVANAATTSGGFVGFQVQINGDTGSNYSFNYMYSTGAGATGATSSLSQTSTNDGSLTNAVFNTTVWQFQDYANTTTFKTWLCRSGAGIDGWNKSTCSTWRSTAAITSIKVFHVSNQLASGTSVSLYGIKSE